MRGEIQGNHSGEQTFTLLTEEHGVSELSFYACLFK